MGEARAAPAMGGVARANCYNFFFLAVNKRDHGCLQTLLQMHVSPHPLLPPLGSYKPRRLFILHGGGQTTPGMLTRLRARLPCCC